MLVNADDSQKLGFDAILSFMRRRPSGDRTQVRGVAERSGMLNGLRGRRGTVM